MTLHYAPSDVTKQAQKSELPAKLFHYTDAAGFLGILEHGEVWATDVRCMNDAEEIRYAARYVAEKFQEMGDESIAAFNDQYTYRGYSFYGNAEEWYRSLDVDDKNLPGDYTRAYLTYKISDQYARIAQSGNLDVTGRSSTYAACFSSNPDLLGQWRGYAGTQGFSIGFHADKLSAVTVNATHDIIGEPQKILYGEEGGNEHLRGFADNLSVLESDADDPVEGKQIKLSMSIGAIEHLATVKHESFKDEREWRLIINAMSEPGDGTPDFRAGGAGGLLPFLRLQLPDACIESVRVGPGPEAELRVLMAEKALARFGYDGIRVTTSDAPYRP